MVHKKYIVVTRPRRESIQFQKKLEDMGYSVLQCPSISIAESKLSVREKKSLKNLSSFDWIIFTSKNGVRYFLESLKKLKVNSSVLQTKKIAAVGPSTALELQKNNIHTDFIPTEFTTKKLGEEINGIHNKNVLLPRANIASKTLANILREKGAEVVEIVIYKTNFVTSSHKMFESLIPKIYGITFTSPSTVKGFVDTISHSKNFNTIQSIPIFSIGPVTTKAAKQFGFHNVHTAKVHTINGVLSLIKENSL